MIAALALDIGATKLAAAVVDADGRAVGWTTAPTAVQEGPARILDRLFALADTAIERAGAEVGAVGISCGGPLDPAAGLLLGPLHLPGWDRVPVRDAAERRFGVPGLLVNDGSAGAWAEFRFGAARDASSAIYLTVSSGIGGGAVIDGRLLAGASGNGGEFGHVVVRPGGRRCTCGRLGCVEAYAAGTQMAARAVEAVRSGEPTALAGVERPTAADVFDLSSRDRAAALIWREGIDALATAVVDIVNVLEPERVVLGGGLTRAGEALLAPVRDAVAGTAMPRIRELTRVVTAELGAQNCAIGVGTLALAGVAAEGVVHV